MPVFSRLFLIFSWFAFVYVQVEGRVGEESFSRVACGTFVLIIIELNDLYIYTL